MKKNFQKFQQKPDPFQKQLDLIAQQGQAGRLDQVQSLCQTILKSAPYHPKALHFLGLAAFQLGHHDDAKNHLQKALKKLPQSPEIWGHLALVYHALKQSDLCIEAFQKALTFNPFFTEAHYNLALVYQNQKHYDLAEKHYHQILAINAHNPIVYNQLGNLLQEQGQIEKALGYYDQALRLNPGYAECLYNKAMALHRIQQTEQAIFSYQQAIQRNPQYYEAYNNLGTLYQALEYYTHAIEAFKQALKIKPDFIPALKNLADTYCTLDNYTEACQCYLQGLALDPENGELVNGLVIALKNDANWPALEFWQEKLIKIIEKQLQSDTSCSLSPFNAMSLWLDDEMQYRIARHHAQHTFQAYENRLPLFKASLRSLPQKRLRIGYVSADFRDHPVAHLLMGVLREHDRTQYEITAYSIGPDDGSSYRQQIKAHCDHFIDLFRLSDLACAKQIAEDEIHILVDLMGYTRYARPDLFALRPAPVQIGYLGYPGTSGTTFMDYYVADRISIPPEQAPFFSEKLLYLPHTYFATNDQMAVADNPPSRSECGLPEQAMVYCCFCTHYKIEPRVFSAWMHILKAVPQSVLWLFSRGKPFERHLKSFASQHDVDPERLIFAYRETKERHLARHCHADLFLDTLVYNAHTTAIDALWMNVPLITCSGNSTANRVSASLLHAIELPELITYHLDDYIRLAIHYGQERSELIQLKEKLRGNIAKAALFNTTLYTQHLEQAYQTAWELKVKEASLT